jgi:hypothetical protein
MAERSVNPFVYSRPLPPGDVIDREAESERMLALAAGGHFVCLVAPRRYGKTSLLGKLLEDARERDGMAAILVDLYGVLSLADVAVRIERAYARQLKGAVRRTVERFLESTGLGLSLGAYGISVRLQLERHLDPLPSLHALLDLPLRLEGSGRALVAFDEFQDVRKVEGLEELLRGHIQHQGEVASYVFAGSEPGMMRALFEDRARPLYGQAEPVRLGTLADADIAAYVRERFEETGRDCGEALAGLVRVAQGHPQRAMLLAHRLWDETERGATAGPDEWVRALERTRAQVEPELDALWRRLEPSEQRVLRAIAATGGTLYREDVLASLGLKKATAHGAAGRLAARGEIEQLDAGFRFVDPLLEDWLRKEPFATSG